MLHIQAHLQKFQSQLCSSFTQTGLKVLRDMSMKSRNAATDLSVVTLPKLAQRKIKEHERDARVPLFHLLD